MSSWMPSPPPEWVPREGDTTGTFVGLDRTQPRLRAIKGRTLLKRVIPRTERIWMAPEVMGITDTVMQLGHVVATDSTDFEAGALVVYPSPRVHDHFTWDGDEILVVPTYWVSAHVTDTFLANHPEAREYGRPLV